MYAWRLFIRNLISELTSSLSCDDAIKFSLILSRAKSDLITSHDDFALGFTLGKIFTLLSLSRAFRAISESEFEELVRRVIGNFDEVKRKINLILSKCNLMTS